MGMKNGLGHGDRMRDDDDDVERIDGTRKIFELDNVRGCLDIGLKNVNSVLILSGDEASLSVSCVADEDDDVFDVDDELELS
jgi:hypothetical protein